MTVKGSYANQSLDPRNVVGRRIKLTQQIPAGGLGFLNAGEEYRVLASCLDGVCVQSSVCKEPIILQEESFEFVN